MKKILFSISLVSLLSSSAFAFDTVNIQNPLLGTSLGGDIGTTGVGITWVKPLKVNNKWGVRVGYHQYSKNYTTDDNQVHYDFDLNLQDFQLMADYHPWNTSFKFTFGAMYNGNDLDGKITPNSGTTYEFNGHTYTTAQIGYVKTSVDFDNDIAPYIGIGWDTSFYKTKGWGFTFNLGVAYTGSAKVSYTPNISSSVPASVKAQILSDLDVEKASLQDDLDKYKYLPYISIGFNYKF